MDSPEALNGHAASTETSTSGKLDDSPKLKRKITLLNGVGLIVGTIVGSGIFVSPTGVYVATHSVGMSIVIWSFSGIFSMLGALCYAELGTSVTRSGGDYAYIYVAFGPLAAFLRLWMAMLIIRPTTQAIVAITFAEYAAKPFFTECKPPDNAVRLLAAVCLCLLTAINCLSTRLSMRIQDIFTFAKLFALIAIILTGLYFLATGHTENFENAFEGNYDVSSIALSFYSGLFAFGGWNYLNFVTEELKDPYRNLPRAIWIGLPVVTIVYVLANVAYFAVLSGVEMESSYAVALSFGLKTYGSFTWLVSIFVALSCFGGVNGILFTSARLFVTGAQERHLPEIFSYIHVRRSTPIPSLIFTCAASLAMLFVRDVIVLINYYGQILWFSVAASIAGMMILRYRQPDAPRPIRVHTSIPIIFLFACGFLILFPIPSQPWNTIIGAAITLSGIPVYYLFIKWKKAADYSSFSARITRFLQQLMELTSPEATQLLSKS
ncbi:Y+L amino acid transporter 2 isoform X1 [Euwallacea similis]|uniref:Y+L amino acid transporter 2 isoform X1 n=2 Tax=Euwallacea similis TaxID=1736056 RepID=UPI00344BE884